MKDLARVVYAMTVSLEDTLKTMKIDIDKKRLFQLWTMNYKNRLKE